MSSKNGLEARDLLRAIRNLSKEDMVKAPQATVEAVFKNIDMSFTNKIQAIGLYEQFIRERSSSLKKLINTQNKIRVARGESRDSVLKEERSSQRPNYKSTVDFGLALYQANSSEPKLPNS